MATPAIIVTQKRKPQLEKAKLMAYNGESDDIELMFNPTEISFSRSVEWKSNDGNRGTELLPKVNFSGVKPYTFSLKQLLFDTYETKESVMKKYVDKIKKGVETIKGARDKRPPVYILTWGNEYFYCVITKLTYTLNMFLSDGTPVRAMVDIDLQEVDKNNLPGGKESKSKGPDRKPDKKVTKK
ncbi:MAG: hypothetical protein RMZ69_03025 [Nostoc sp. ChiQUE01a]|uniref:CIS tube protein n=1 Tax=Nostoc sp. CCY 9925 TaxID=3103865 RepID=UPI002ADB7FB2|nr:hypothetical protein [Nostoc sp. DedQUE11]MDZ8076279.1 hypothetical protein [Nostoc sp. DedQUE01]MDZ8081428.1 hypothetical protein [Nostoc sp. DcaGUA01]MDZ8236141.1 hypothetical protein [Nostoc sp. ChiQUE01a]